MLIRCKKKVLSNFDNQVKRTNTIITGTQIPLRESEDFQNLVSCFLWKTMLVKIFKCSKNIKIGYDSIESTKLHENSEIKNAGKNIFFRIQR
jgi:hypothetical protein